MIDFLLYLELPWMLAAMVVLTVSYALFIALVVRMALHASGVSEGAVLPVNPALLTVAGGMFALMLAFSAAGIWTDVLQARSAVQREANALENVYGLANALSADLRDTVKNGVINYSEGVVERDWPAMMKKIPIGDPVYGNSDRVLVALIDYLSGVIAQGDAPPIMSALMTQLFEARSARVIRLTIAGGGMSWAQWAALFFLITIVLTLAAITHYQHRGFQIVALALYAAGGGAFLFVILAHDHPFVRESSVSPRPLVELATKTIN